MDLMALEERLKRIKQQATDLVEERIIRKPKDTSLLPLLLEIRILYDEVYNARLAEDQERKEAKP